MTCNGDDTPASGNAVEPLSAPAPSSPGTAGRTSIGDIGGGHIVEGVHLLRLDGIERVSAIKVGEGPIGAFVDALARGLCRELGKSPESLRPDDLERASASLVDGELRWISRLVGLRAEGRCGSDMQARRSFARKLRMRVAARMLGRLSHAFVEAAAARIQVEAAERGALVWM
jgi:hypothetical protein